MTEQAMGLYVHIPWCVRKCPYCDFNSHPARGELPVDDYVDALLRDLSAQLEALPTTRIGTVFFGGGTPSLFPPAAFARVLEHLGERIAPQAEITMEANPGTTEHGDLKGYRLAGINRLSFGAQSFNEAHLIALGRIHDPQAIYRSFDLARAAGFDNVNLDLMYGLPRQTRDEALADLDAAITLAPEHVSWYQLTLEPKTEFARRPPPLPSDLMLAATEDAGYEKLDRAGFGRYEVSAFARAGRRCRHNLGYWTFADYLGVGAGAHGKLSTGLPLTVRRTRKAHQPRVYLADPVTTVTEALDPGVLPGEFMLNALRLVDGVELERFVVATGLPLEALEPARSRQIANGLLEPDRLAATRRGFALLDSLIQDYL
ncbi:MAG TPA: radical SAM family heme chaperone HemW [Pseudomonadales bacterium]